MCGEEKTKKMEAKKALQAEICVCIQGRAPFSFPTQHFPGIRASPLLEGDRGISVTITPHSVSTLLFHPHQEAHEFLFTFCHYHGIICISEVVDIFPRNLDSSL